MFIKTKSIFKKQKQNTHTSNILTANNENDHQQWNGKTNTVYSYNEILHSDKNISPTL